MFWYARLLLLAMLLNLGNSEKQMEPSVDETQPFRVYSNNGNQPMVEFPSIPALQGIPFSVYIKHKSHILDISYQASCLSQLFLQRRLYNSSNIHPLEYNYDSRTYNVTFFNCSSAAPRFESIMCPIVALDSQDSVLSMWNLTSCTMISRLPSPVPAEYLQHWRRLNLKWPKVDKHKTRRISLITGDTTIAFAHFP